MRIAFIGYGELGRQVHDLIKPVVSPLEAVYFDDHLHQSGESGSFPFAQYTDERFADCQFVVALGYNQMLNKAAVLNRLKELGRSIYTFIHPTSFVSESAVIGKGTVAYPMCNIDREVSIGNGVVLNNSVTISHNNSIGDCCYLSPGVTLSGNVKVGEHTFIGTGAVVANNINIGKNVVVGIGTVVTSDVEDGVFVIGNPMKLVKKIHLV